MIWLVEWGKIIVLHVLPNDDEKFHIWRSDDYASSQQLSFTLRLKAWFPYRCICRVCRTKEIHRTDRIHSISYNKMYLSFLFYWAFVREVSIKLYLSYEFFSYDRHDRYDRYNDMETRLNVKAIRAEQAKVHVAYFTQRDQHEIIT